MDAFRLTGKEEIDSARFAAMLAKLLYECRPYVYLLAGLVLLMLTDDWLMAISALLIYGAGSLLWIQRACLRGQNSRKFPAQLYRSQHKRLDQALDHFTVPNFLPTHLYEALPFGYLLAGMLCFKFEALFVYANLILAAATLLTAMGLLVWALRGYHRGYHRGHETPYPQYC